MSQDRRRRGRWIALIIVNAFIVLAAVGAWAFYETRGKASISAAYRGESHPALNRLIQGQDVHEEAYYQARGRELFVRLLAGWVLGCVLIESLVLYLVGLKSVMTAPRPESRHPGWNLFLISFFLLFLELAAIRWFPAYVVFLTFFSNFVLIAAFVGMSVGCLAARRKAHLIHLVPPLMLVGVLLGGLVYVLATRVGAFVLKVGSATDPEHVFFGTIFQAQVKDRLVLPVEAVVSVFFVIIALMFVGVGQELGRALDRIDNRIKAYTINIGGSLVGIAAFTAASYFSLPPLVWFGVGFVCLMFYLRTHMKRRVVQVLALAVCLAGMGVMEWMTNNEKITTYWSPYYNIRYGAATGEITVNTIGHQHMADRETGGIAYSLPYILRKQVGGDTDDVLIIGAGSGNDAAHALWHGVRRVDAVEIDPVIERLGRQHHPNRPYDDPRVTRIVSDGRHVLKTADHQYDLIIYALVDSLTLHSCYSSVRLESFLFTKEAFEDIKAHLNEGGVFVAYNYFRQGWVVTRLKDMLTEVFGHEPIVIALPSREVVRDTDQYAGMTMLLAGDIEDLRSRFEEAGGYTLDVQDFSRNLTLNGFEPIDGADTEGTERIFPAALETTRASAVPTDDWPFFYLKDRRVPRHNLWGLAIILGLSLAILLIFAPVRRVRFNPHFFFLGAGFMLIETNSIIRLALLFGSTWLVNSIVFFAILVMILLANLYVILVKPVRMRWYYVALLAALALNVGVNLDWFLEMGRSLRVVLSCVFTFLPILFAGVIFSSSFRRSRDPDMDFGANIAGVVLGGMLEYVALVTGYRLVLLIVIALYALSLLGLRRLGRAPAPLAEG